MSQEILIIGESGSGKSTSLENLNPKETFIVNLEILMLDKKVSLLQVLFKIEIEEGMQLI